MNANKLGLVLMLVFLLLVCSSSVQSAEHFIQCIDPNRERVVYSGDAQITYFCDFLTQHDQTPLHFDVVHEDGTTRLGFKFMHTFKTLQTCWCINEAKEDPGPFLLRISQQDVPRMEVTEWTVVATVGIKKGG